MNTSRGEVTQANVYNACDDEYRKGVLFNKEKLLKSPHHSVKVDGDKLDVVIDKDAEDIDDIFQSKGTAIPPDEILDMVKTSDIRIPVKQRNEFPENARLPSSDLLKVLHYFASKKMTSVPENKGAVRSLDETALLALGMMVEQWAEDTIDEASAQLFLESTNDDMEEEIYNKDSEADSSSQGSSSDSNSDSDSSSNSDSDGNN